MNDSPAHTSLGDQGILHEAASPDLSAIWVDRDPGWLEFNSRVLAGALDERTPLLERVTFLAIFGSNLDEFFMKRICGQLTFCKNCRGSPVITGIPTNTPGSISTSPCRPKTEFPVP